MDERAKDQCVILLTNDQAGGKIQDVEVTFPNGKSVSGFVSSIANDRITITPRRGESDFQIDFRRHKVKVTMSDGTERTFGSDDDDHVSVARPARS